MRALVTGAAGLIGSHLVRVLCGLGHSVRALMRPTSRQDALASIPAEFVLADVLQLDDQLRSACARCDVVFHTAAHFAYSGFTADSLHRTAVTGTENVLIAGRDAGVSRFVVTSSSVVFGYADARVIIDESRGLAQSDNELPYILAKLAQHRRALALADELGLNVLLACPTITVGPTAAGLGPSNGIIAAYLNDPFRCTFAGGCNLVSARDIAHGHVAIALEGIPGEAYLLGAENLTWREIHTAIAELAGVQTPLVELNHTLAFLAAAAEEARARLSGRAPLSTREQATLVGRFYWYSHEKAAALRYEPSPARHALVEALSWLAASSHISREVRTGMHLCPEIYRFRSAEGSP